MKTTRSRRTWAIVGVLAATALAWALVRAYPWKGGPELTELRLEPTAPPLVFFETASPLDPGMLRILIKAERPVLREFRDALAGSVTAAFQDGAPGTPRELVAFTEVWQHENVVEIRIPLTAVAQRDRAVRCVVGAREFLLHPRGLPGPRIGVEEISLPGGEDPATLTVVNRIDEPVEIGEVRVNGRPAAHGKPIRVPARGRARLLVRGVPGPEGDVSVVLAEGGSWFQAYEVSDTPAFAFLDWDSDGSGPARTLRRSGPLAGSGTIVDTAVDVCSTEAARGMRPGSYLADLRKLMTKAADEAERARTRGSPGDREGVRPHSFVFLTDGGRPASHFIYGRLGDYVGVASLDPRLSMGDLRDVAFWLRMDRAIVAPRHLLVLPGVLRRSTPPGDALNERDIRRLVLASLSVGPRGLVYYRPEADPRVVASGDSPVYGQAVAAITGELDPIRPLLTTATPVDWVYREGGAEGAQDRDGATGYFALWSGQDRLIVIALGYPERGWLALPKAVRIAEALWGHVEMLGDPEGGGRIALKSPTPEGPGIAVFRLAADFVEDGDVRWLPF